MRSILLGILLTVFLSGMAFHSLEHATQTDDNHKQDCRLCLVKAGADLPQVPVSLRPAAYPAAPQFHSIDFPSPARPHRSEGPRGPPPTR